MHSVAASIQILFEQHSQLYSEWCTSLVVGAVNWLHSSGQHSPAEHGWRTTDATQMWRRTDRKGGPHRARQNDSDGLPPTQTQAWSHLQKLNGAHTDCTLLINGCKQTRRLLRPTYLSRQSDDRGECKHRLWSSLYVHVSISLPSCLFCADTHTMEEGEASKEYDMQAGTCSARKCHCRLGVSRCFQMRKVGG